MLPVGQLRSFSSWNLSPVSPSAQSCFLTWHFTLLTKLPESLSSIWASLVAQRVKNLSAVQETWVGRIPWRRVWVSTSVSLSGKFHGQRRLAGYSPWVCKPVSHRTQLATVGNWEGLFSLWFSQLMYIISVYTDECSVNQNCRLPKRLLRDFPNYLDQWSLKLRCISESLEEFLIYFLSGPFRVFIELVTTLLLFYISVFWPWGMWDLSSITRDWTCAPCFGRQNLNHWTIREVLWRDFFFNWLSRFSES